MAMEASNIAQFEIFLSLYLYTDIWHFIDLSYLTPCTSIAILTTELQWMQCNLYPCLASAVRSGRMYHTTLCNNTKTAG